MSSLQGTGAELDAMLTQGIPPVPPDSSVPSPCTRFVWTRRSKGVPLALFRIYPSNRFDRADRRVHPGRERRGRSRPRAASVPAFVRRFAHVHFAALAGHLGTVGNAGASFGSVREPMQSAKTAAMRPVMPAMISAWL